ncbi:amino acid adenylation domain-containing protein [Streptomyces sp. NPDC002446]
MTDLDERLAALSPHKRALLEKMLAESGQAESTFPIAVLQQGMWFLEQLRPDNPAYVVPSAVRIRGPLDTKVLSAALDEIVRRHEALRTTFQLRDGKPTQVVSDHLSVAPPETDLRQLGLTEEELESRIAAEALGEPFDLQAGPLLRMSLLRTGDDEYVLVMALHHLISDRWSVGILLTELSALYEAKLSGLPSPLPELPVQYGDFATWQQHQLAKGRWEGDLAYWREHLAGAPAALELPTDKPRPAVQGFNGATLPVRLPKELMDELGALAGRHGATPYMALLAAFTVLLHRYSNQDDVVVAVPTAVRGRAEIESLIGYFVNTLPLRTRLDGEAGFVQVLEQVRDACLGAYEHQEVPFELLVTDLKTTRDLSRPPVCQVSFSYGREPVPTLAMGGAELRRLLVRSEGARFDLELQAFDDDGALSGWFEYDRDLFEEATVARLAGHFRHLIEEAVADPRRAVDELELLDAAERHRVLVGANDTARAWPEEDGLIHQCFEARAREHPDAEALRFEGTSLSYAELNRRANQLAHRLIRLGVGRDVLVGVSMERSLELVVALLAVVKAGGAYVPLDPTYPASRLEHMIGDSRVPVLLTQRRVLETLPPAATAEVLCLEELADELAAEPDHDPDVPVDGEDLAYVIYTSGSTGLPKGVMNVHAAIRNRLLWMQDAYRLDASDRVLQKTPFSFDVSVWEFFWPLMAGATLVVARPEGHKDGGYLARAIREEHITTVHFVPSMLQVFLQERVEECVSLRRVICSGEALPRDLQDRFLARSGAELHNLYGPTEAAIDVTSWACRADGDLRPVPIGSPIANTQLYVLDRHLRPVPTGVAGELHIGGRNLARGYLGRPELTAERFIDNPFAGETPGERLYRTGDLARVRHDGAIEFLGRLDHQVKLRGFRIELGEIEAALTDHALVREAVVVARELQAGDVRLVAYVTPRGEGAPGSGELIGHLKERLPDYMVPAAFEVLDSLPLSPSGKVDRKALPEPASIRPQLATRYVAPGEGLQTTLAALWRKLLGVDRVGLHDNFFDLGGHSLLMAELRTQLTRETEHQVSMVELFQHPTVASLAAFLTRPEGSSGATPSGARDRAENRRRSRARRQQAADRRARSNSSDR